MIEGRGQAVTEEQEGWWIRKKLPRMPGADIYAVELEACDHFTSGYRYMRCPNFPPRKQFVAPPKPELVLVRHSALSDPCWATRVGTGYQSLVGKWWDASEVEFIETTGEVKQ